MSTPEHDASRSLRARRPLTRSRAIVAGLSAALAAALLAPVPASAAPVATAVAPAVITTPVNAAAAKPRMLRRGMRGTDVKNLQLRLKALRYDMGTANGVFGMDTHHAVVAFQKVNGLGRDGVVGPITRAKLARPIGPRPRAPRKGVYLEVNIAKQVLVQYNARTATRIVSISSGSGRYYTQDGKRYLARTPRGKFVIGRYIPGWRKSKLGLLWRPMYFYGGYAIHGSPSVPSYAASHGCIRTPMPTQDRMIALGALRIGRPVYIF
jgi:N-acetylmuramoyl-L-alanine amidase